MIHKVTEDAFFNHPIPEQTKTYIPVKNMDIYSLVREEAENRNFTITGKGFRANGLNNEFLGLVTLNQPEEGLSRMIGFRNSTNKKRSIAFVAGAMVMLCANGMISGDIITIRMHTGSIQEDLRDIVVQAFDEMDPRFKELKEKSALLREKLILKPVAMEIISDLYFTEKMLSATQMAVLREKLYVDKNFSLPTEPDVHFPAWNLYNQITEAMKHGAPANYFGNHIELDKYFDEKLLVV